MSAPEPEFESVQEADATYYGEDTDQGRQWGKLQEKSTEWVAGWSLAYQVAQNDPGLRRWFVIRMKDGQFQALSMSGTAQDYNAETTPLDEMPHTESEKEARQAYQAWIEANYEGEKDGDGDKNGDGEKSGNWSEWTKIQQVGDWWIYGREHKQKDRVQFMAMGRRQDGTTIYLHPDGTPKPERHIYDTQAALQKALDNYAKKKSAGQIPEDKQPTGEAPPKGEVNRGGGGGALPGPIGAAVEAVGGPRNALLISAVGAGGFYYAEKQGYIDWTEAM